MVRRNLRKFCGWEFDSGSSDLAKKKAAMDKWTMAGAKSVAGMLGLEKGAKKEDLVDRILAFLAKPVDAGKKLPKKAAPKRKSSRPFLFCFPFHLSDG